MKRIFGDKFGSIPLAIATGRSSHTKCDRCQRYLFIIKRTIARHMLTIIFLKPKNKIRCHSTEQIRAEIEQKKTTHK